MDRAVNDPSVSPVAPVVSLKCIRVWGEFARLDLLLDSSDGCFTNLLHLSDQVLPGYKFSCESYQERVPGGRIVHVEVVQKTEVDLNRGKYIMHERTSAC